METTPNREWLDAPLTQEEFERLANAARSWVPGGFRNNPNKQAYEVASLFQILIRDYRSKIGTTI